MVCPLDPSSWQMRCSQLRLSQGPWPLVAFQPHCDDQLQGASGNLTGFPSCLPLYPLGLGPSFLNADETWNHSVPANGQPRLGRWWSWAVNLGSIEQREAKYKFFSPLCETEQSAVLTIAMGAGDTPPHWLSYFPHLTPFPTLLSWDCTL